MMLINRTYLIERYKHGKQSDNRRKLIMTCVNQTEETVPLQSLADEELIVMIREGNRSALEYLIIKYERIVRYKTKTYFLIGSDREDVIQEGLIGLYKAICDYDDNKLASFKAFADLCITRQIITSIKTATRLKHSPLNSYVSIYKPLEHEEADRVFLDILCTGASIDPQELLINKEHLENVQALLNKVLSPLEREVLPLYLDGVSYEDIANRLKRSEKAIDNALQRIKRKVTGLISAKQLVY